jgi:hypothetical protein
MPPPPVIGADSAGEPMGRYADSFARDEQGWHCTERKADVEMIGDVSDHLMFDPRSLR